MATPTLNAVPTSTVTEPSDSLIGALLIGTQWGTETGGGVALTYSVPTSDDFHAENYSSSDEWDGFSALTSGEQDAVTSALAAWAAVADITFTKVSESSGSVGEIRFAESSVVEDSDSVAWAYYPRDVASAGDVWLNPNDFDSETIQQGWPEYKTLLHEIGHALGLKHSFDDVDGSAPTVPANMDSYHYTVMSYTALPSLAVNASMYPTTPMLLDIAAVQYLYGANMTWHSGDDAYAYSSDGEYLETLWDAGGTDTIAYDGRAGAVIDLNDGQFSQLGQPITYSDGATSYDTVAIAYGVVIENASGGEGPDVLIGNDVANTLTGGGGADTLTGGGGADAFAYATSDDGGDVIIDFTPGSDQLAVSATGFDASGFVFDEASDGLFYQDALLITLSGVSGFDESAVLVV